MSSEEEQGWRWEKRVFVRNGKTRLREHGAMPEFSVTRGVVFTVRICASALQ